MKKCNKCGEIKPLSEFYPHPQMKDGHLGKCRDCAKIDSHHHYQKNRDKYREYERKRYQDPKRKAYSREQNKTSRAKNPEKYIARTALGNAIRDGRVIRHPCEVCGNEKSEAHHDDYSKPLEVRWLCKKHHWEHHNKTSQL